MQRKREKMDTNTIILLAISAVIFLLIGGALGVVFMRRQRTKRLKDRFGPEYDHALKETGDKGKVEDELEARVDHVKSLDIKQLSREQRERFIAEWRSTQAEFVDQPMDAIRDANQLVKDVMRAKGYPVDDFEQRVADISVDYPDLVTNYRGMRDIVNKSEHEEVDTEELRQAMVHCRALFEELLGADVNEDLTRKEKM
jgi:hypothetical protein